MNERIFLSPPHMSGNEMKYIQEAFDTNWIAPLGTNVDKFEEELCEYVGVDHGLALSSGTAGIHLALKYFGVGPGDYVFCSDLTFAGSCNPILYEYANPVFIDSEPESWNMSPIALEKAFDWAKKENKMPKAVIIVDLYGQSADYDSLLPICERFGVPVIEDAAEALGATYKGKKCGSFGHISIFSFNGNKIITTSGGGMVVSNDEEAIKKMRFWATQSKEQAKHYEHKEVGYNYRMSNISAGIGRGQLQALDGFIQSRKSINAEYRALLSNLPVEFMPFSSYGEPNYWLSVLTVTANEPDIQEVILNELEKENIEARPVWKPMHLQPLFCNEVFFAHTDKQSDRLFKTGICLPSGTGMSSSDLQRVVGIINESLKAVMK
ncbi:pyridoxal phosphate-dependent aminotransferase [Bacillus sp. FJAT-27264]|uniref:DegT/DnrJ/EryC1/StrS family aminotransferase n=1 Tax=Paenibacillus sp. (strain DSM 101736 / FJAT-27264) TaxID=1850362 RepID=UPI000807D222|nr:DegT/DnrJ/EryC1/StrS family aminotransferase [Bacillus sp. FJAT-27264]OBZ09816.1 pyridoxal phosphate-dependent aminotransferase [Bacillus sp. FJAT-27264]